MNEHTQAILKEALIEAMKINDDGLLMSSERDWIRSHVVKDFFKILTAQENSELNSEVSCQEGWISVEDRLPEEHETVNVYAYQGVVSAGWYCGDNMWLVMREPIRVTHWQPLPTPPKEGE